MVPDETMPMVSVIVCVFNDETHLGSCLTALIQQTYPADRREFILVDDGSTDNSSTVVKRFPSVRYVYQSNQGPSIARNIGIKNSKGDIVLFIDSDCEAANDWMMRLVHALRENTSRRIVAVGGSQCGHPLDTPFARHVDQYLNAIGFVGDYVKPYAGTHLVSHNASCNSGYHRGALLEAGGFRPGMFPGEDVDLDRRLTRMGYKILFTPDAIVYHHRPNSKKQWTAMLSNYGRAQADNISIHGFFRRIHFVPPVMMIVLFIIGIFVIKGNYGLAILLLALGFAIPLIYLKKRGKELGWIVTLYFTFTTLIYYFIGFWSRLVRNIFSPPFSLKRHIDSI
jgi:glycosyltransferase involved in cell wall biosynthesis